MINSGPHLILIKWWSNADIPYQFPIQLNFDYQYDINYMGVAAKECTFFP